MMRYDRVYAPVYLDRMEENMRAMQKNLRPGTMIIGVVKADGYGHGAVPTAKTIDRFVCGFAVATVDEALALRRHGIKKGILVLGVSPRGRYEELVRQDIRPAIFCYEWAKELSDVAVGLGRQAKIHIAVDTGMSRIGLPPTKESADLVKRIFLLPGIKIEGIFSHFAAADEADKEPAMRQLENFTKFAELVEKRGVTIPIRHCSNSAGIIDLFAANLDAVRAGISIYGLYPSDEVDRSAVLLKPAMELKSYITYLKTIEAGTPVSYGGTFVTGRRTRIATVSAGYGDGYPRSLSGKGQVLVCGRRADILGRICMDQLMIDVTEISEAEEGSVVTLLGRDGEQEITMEELARTGGGFHYEIPCVLTKRVPRVYFYNGRQVGEKDYFDDRYEGF